MVATARTAVASGDVTSVLKWVLAEDEGEIEAAFQRTLAVRTKGAPEKDLADM